MISRTDDPSIFTFAWKEFPFSSAYQHWCWVQGSDLSSNHQHKQSPTLVAKSGFTMKPTRKTARSRKSHHCCTKDILIKCWNTAWDLLAPQIWKIMQPSSGQTAHSGLQTIMMYIVQVVGDRPYVIPQFAPVSFPLLDSLSCIRMLHVTLCIILGYSNANGNLMATAIQPMCPIGH